MLGRNHSFVVGRAVLLAHFGLVLGGYNPIGMEVHIDSCCQVSGTASLQVQEKCKWKYKYKLEQGHLMGNSPLLAYTDSEAVLIGQNLQADDERI